LGRRSSQQSYGYGGSRGTSAGEQHLKLGSRSKWWLVGLFWLVQGAAIYFITPAFIASAANVSPSTKNLGTFGWHDYAEVLLSLEWLNWAVIMIPVISIAQFVFVWPVHRPAPKRERGWPVWRSLGVAALAIAALSTALMAAVSQATYSATGFDIAVKTGIRINTMYIGIAWCLVSWAIATPLLIRFCKRGPRESLLARISSRLFVGTVVETAAIIPMDVLVRKRESCYCFAGTYAALLICGGVGIFILGPAIFLPILVKRRRRWFDGNCEWCGYDMRATPKADRCPECGMGWRGEAEGIKV
jgi:hypothetical protein